MTNYGGKTKKGRYFLAGPLAGLLYVLVFPAMSCLIFIYMLLRQAGRQLLAGRRKAVPAGQTH